MTCGSCWWYRLWLVGVVSLCVTLAACGQSAMPGAPTELPISGPVPDAPGRLLYARNTQFWTLAPSTKETQLLVTFDGAGYPVTPAVSPDGARIAYSLYQPGTDANDPIAGTDLYVMNTDGTEQRCVLAHEHPGEALTEPVWTPDGRTLYFTRRSPDSVARIERVQVDGSARTIVAEQAQSPTISADGQQLAYLALDPQNSSALLMVARSDGTHAHPVLADRTFQQLV